ncbi:hypothetical protein VE01_07931 [Pseudogymnoascus verrucosus]|uniref:O-methyltransferase C-terminal domain-containing protein n=1 Tax=Pseudogymnoascus verrucosus TaxID=342668 RepID=A0A1B8GFI1_9PEZI|nr:uncharacterized protein VE01_07931 [Pseudogymnoascus verrucosus]OBT94584.1 hypothetical protein VE01_07931 [Pseudogymnoascus verrucosus]
MALKPISIINLSREILTLTERVAAYFSEKNLPEPSFDASYHGTPNDPEFEEIQAPLIEALADLSLLVQGPKIFLRTFGLAFQDLAAFQIALEFNFFKNIPLEGSITSRELARAAGIGEDITASAVRLLATQRIFVESEPGVFQHTSISAVLGRDDDIQAAIHMEVDDMFKAASDIDLALRKEPKNYSHESAPFNIRHGDIAYDWYSKNPRKGARFAQAMTGFSKLDRPISPLRDEYPWASLGRGKVVDVGGGNGSISMMLAKEFPDLEFIVQDISEDMMRQASLRKEMDGLEGRVTFMQHDFFEPQPIHDARAFFLRHISHNYVDSECVKILRALIPALEKRPGTPVLINDVVLPELNSKERYKERIMRQTDIAMFVVLGAKQRSASQFHALVKQADPRFEIKKIHGNLNIGLVEVVLGN